jgi:hypothetical protein
MNNFKAAAMSGATPLTNNSLAGFEIISSHLGKLKNLDLSYNIFNDSTNFKTSVTNFSL